MTRWRFLSLAKRMMQFHAFSLNVRNVLPGNVFLISIVALQGYCRLNGVNGSTCAIALCLLWLRWVLEQRLELHCFHYVLDRFFLFCFYSLYNAWATSDEYVAVALSFKTLVPICICTACELYSTIFFSMERILSKKLYTKRFLSRTRAAVVFTTRNTSRTRIFRIHTQRITVTTTQFFLNHALQS